MFSERNSSGNEGKDPSLNDLTQMVHVNIPYRILGNMDEYITNDKHGRRHESRSSAIRELLAIGLWFAKRRDEFETIFNNPELMDEINSQLKEGGLVDYVQRMNFEQFLIVWQIFKTEAKSRKMIK